MHTQPLGGTMLDTGASYNTCYTPSMFLTRHMRMTTDQSKTLTRGADQALTSFNGLVKELDPAGADDIQAYRTWLEKRAPIDFTETRFLERKNDLLAVSRPGSISATRSSQHQSAVVWLPAMLVLPLLAFVIVPSVLGRLVVIALIGGAGFRQVTLTPELLAYMTVQEWSIAASV